MPRRFFASTFAIVLALTCVVTLPGTSLAISLDEKGDISFGVRTYVNTRFGTEDTDRDVRYRRNPDGTLNPNSDGFPVAIYRTQTFPKSTDGSLRQNRFFIEAEFKHKLDRLRKKGVAPLTLLDSLPFKVRRLGYGLTYRGEYDGIYDWGPSEYKDTWNAGQFFTSEGDKVPANPVPAHTAGSPLCDTFPSDERCRRIVDVPSGRRDLRSRGVHRSRLFQAYVEADIGRSLWFRLGRQVVGWGETDSFRLLDNINPIDDSFGGFLVPLDERRVPLDMLRVQYRIGELGPLYEMFVEVFGAIDDEIGYAPGVPKGSPWTLPNLGEPSPLNEAYVTRPQQTFEDMRGGGRVVFNHGDATYTLAHYYTYADRPALQVSISQGFPLRTFADGLSAVYQQTPARVQITGAAATFPVPMNLARALRFSGQPIIRSEAAYFRGEPRYRQEDIDPFIVYRTPGGPLSGNRRTGDSINFVVGLDLNQFIRPLNSRQSFLISTQFFYKRLLDAADDGPLPFGRFKADGGEVLPVPGAYVQPQGLNDFYATEPIFVRQPTDQFLQTLLISTSYMSSMVNPQLLLFYDWGGAVVVQPSVKFVYDPFRFVIDYTMIEASSLKGGSGVHLLRDRDNVQLRFEYVI